MNSGMTVRLKAGWVVPVVACLEDMVLVDMGGQMWWVQFSEIETFTAE